jgi:hypothetical protein
MPPPTIHGDGRQPHSHPRRHDSYPRYCYTNFSRRSATPTKDGAPTPMGCLVLCDNLLNANETHINLSFRLDLVPLSMIMRLDNKHNDSMCANYYGCNQIEYEWISLT